MAARIPLCLLMLATLWTAEAKVYDLTHPFGRDTIYWPTAEPNFFNLSVVFKGILQDDIWLEMNRFTAEEHGGTHMDAPAHLFKGGHTVDQISPDNLQGPGVIVDISRKAAANRNATVTVEDLKAWESKYGRIPVGAIVLMNSGWSKKWNNRTDYLGTSKTGAAGAAELTFPGFDTQAATFLVNQREISGVGVDTPSLDPGTSETFPSHRIFFSKNKFGLENVADVHLLPPKGAMISAFPIKITGGSGAPCRVMATLFDGAVGGATRPNYFMSLVVAFTLALLKFV